MENIYDEKPTVVIEEKCESSISTITQVSANSDQLYYFDNELDLYNISHRLIELIKQNIVEFVEVYKKNNHRLQKDFLQIMMDMLDESFEYIYNIHENLTSKSLSFDEIEEVVKTLLEIDVIIKINTSILIKD
jgi:hypothetical protein